MKAFADRHRAVLVTGASSGIGRATARELDRRGWWVHAGVRRQADADDASASGLYPIWLDVTDAEAIAEARRALADPADGPPLKAVVHSAGITTFGPLESTSPERFRQVMEVNVLGVHALTRALLPALRSSRGRIVLLGSTSGRLALPYLGAYAASKHALEAYADALRRELSGHGVAVTLLQPGRVDTPMLRDAPLDEPDRWDGTPYAQGVRRLAARANAQPAPLRAQSVATRIADALEAKHPPSRVLMVPGSRWKALVAQWMPDRWLDWIIAR